MSVSLARAPKPGDPFWDLLVADARAWGMNPRDLALVMMAESTVNPSALNDNGGAAGLNQLSNPKNYAPLTRDAYLALDASAQWNLAVQKFFDAVITSHPSVKEGGARDLYWLNWAPATYKPNTPDDAVIVRPGVNYGTTQDPMMGEWMIRDNQGFILPADKGAPVVRPAGLTAFLVKQSSGGNAPRWQEVLTAIDLAEKGVPNALNGPGTRPQIGPPGHVPAPPPHVAAASLGGPALVLGMLGFVAWAKSRRMRRRS